VSAQQQNKTKTSRRRRVPRRPRHQNNNKSHSVTNPYYPEVNNMKFRCAFPFPGHIQNPM